MDGKAEDLSAQKALGDLEVQATERASVSRRCSQLCPMLVPTRQQNSQRSVLMLTPSRVLASWGGCFS